MQSHASRHVASEFLKDRHPDLSPPFPKVGAAAAAKAAWGCSAAPHESVTDTPRPPLPACVSSMAPPPS